MPDYQAVATSRGPGGRVLIFFPHNPYPPITGAHRMCAEIIGGFRRFGWSVVLASSTRTTDTPWTPESVAGIERDWGAAVHIYESGSRDLQFARFVGRLCRLANRTPALNSPLHTPPWMRAWFHSLAKKVAPDMIFMNYAYWDGLVTGLRQTSNATTTIYTHDLLTANDKLRASLSGILPKEPLDIDKIPEFVLDEQYISMLNLSADSEEFEIYDRYDYTIALSDSEAQAIEERAPHTKTVKIVPTYTIATQSNAYESAPIFAAGSHVLNQIGYAYLARRVMPEILREEPRFAVDVTGNLNLATTDSARAGISLRGFVPDLAAYYAHARFAVVPVFRGTGTPVKVIEAMAYGLPMVVLDQCVEGGLVRHGINGLIAKDASGFAQHMLSLWRQPDLCRTMGEQARFDAREFSERQMNSGMRQILAGWLK